MVNVHQSIKRKNRNREAIIDSAEIVFFEKGYSNSNMEEIAKHANYTKRTLYSYFNSKEELYIAVAERGYNILSSLFNETLQNCKGDDYLTIIKKLGYTYIRFYKEYTGYYKAAFEFKNTALLPQEIEQDSLKTLTKIIQKGIDNKEIIDEDPINISLMLWSYVVGLINTIVKMDKYVKDYLMKDPTELLEKNFDIILNSIKRSE